MPIDLSTAKLIDNLCQRYSCLPSQILQENGTMIMRMLAVINAGEDD